MILTSPSLKIHGAKTSRRDIPMLRKNGQAQANSILLPAKLRPSAYVVFLINSKLGWPAFMELLRIFVTQVRTDILMKSKFLQKQESSLITSSKTFPTFQVRKVGRLDLRSQRIQVAAHRMKGLLKELTIQRRKITLTIAMPLIWTTFTKCKKALTVCLETGARPLRKKSWLLTIFGTGHLSCLTNCLEHTTKCRR